jgi:hypothetical protein
MATHTRNAECFAIKGELLKKQSRCHCGGILSRAGELCSSREQTLRSHFPAPAFKICRNFTSTVLRDARRADATVCNTEWAAFGLVRLIFDVPKHEAITDSCCRKMSRRPCFNRSQKVDRYFRTRLSFRETQIRSVIVGAGTFVASTLAKSFRFLPRALRGAALKRRMRSHPA